MTPICPHMVIMGSSDDFWLYAIPPLTSNPSSRITVHHLAHDDTDDPRPYTERPFAKIWNYVCEHHHTGSRVSAISCGLGSAAVWQFVTILPPVHQDDTDEHVTVHFLLPISHGRNRAVWLEGTRDDIIVLRFFPWSRNASQPDKHSGYLRLGKPIAINPPLASSIRLPGHKGISVKDLSYSEEDGLICMVCSISEYDRKLMVVNLA